ncbi:MAG: AIM24 family protein, partial [Patescibacteria group bacterium]
MKYEILGNDLQSLSVSLEQGESILTEPGSMIVFDEDVKMDTAFGKGGLWGGMKRLVTGESLFISKFTNQALQPALVEFAAPYPGHIIPIELKEHEGLFYCQKDSFLASTEDVDVTIAFTKKLGAGFFGGEGFILQKHTGNGLSFVHAGGMVRKRILKSGETIKLDT